MFSVSSTSNENSKKSKILQITDNDEAKLAVDEMCKN